MYFSNHGEPIRQALPDNHAIALSFPQGFEFVEELTMTALITDSELTSRIQKGGALLGDMRQLVCHWEKFPLGITPPRFVRDVLPKATQARANDTYIRAFKPRFIDGSPRDAWRLCASLEASLPPQEIVKPFYYWVLRERSEGQN